MHQLRISPKWNEIFVRCTICHDDARKQPLIALISFEHFARTSNNNVMQSSSGLKVLKEKSPVDINYTSFVVAAFFHASVCRFMSNAHSAAIFTFEQLQKWSHSGCNCSGAERDINLPQFRKEIEIIVPLRASCLGIEWNAIRDEGTIGMTWCEIG